MRNGARGTAIHHAAKWGYEDCLRELLKEGALVNVQDGMWRTPLMLAARYAKSPEIIMGMLLNAGADVNRVGCEQRTALHYATARGIDVKILLKTGADLHAQDVDGNTPLHFASSEGHIRVITRLLEEKANVNGKNFGGRLPVHLAAMRGKCECSKILVAHRSHIDLPDSTGHLPIYYAARENHIESVKYLLTLNSPLGGSHSLTYGKSVSNPLQAALERRNLSISRMLVMAGCNTKPLHDFLLDVPQTCWSPDKAGIVIWLKNFTQNPVGLGHSCRLAIRRCMGLKMQKNLNRLPLPRQMKDFIAMRDIDQDCDDLDVDGWTDLAERFGGMERSMMFAYAI